MNIVTKFNFGDLALHSGSVDIAEIKDVVIQSYSGDQPLITYDVVFTTENNVHMQKDFRGNLFESELEPLSREKIASIQQHQAKL